jgi:methyl-accepting chemotaxis protein
MPRSPVARMIGLIVGLDGLFMVLLGYSYIVMMGIEPGRGLDVTIGVAAAVWVVKIFIWCAIVVTKLRPVAACFSSGKLPTDANAISAGLQAAYRAPFGIGLGWALCFSGAWAAMSLILYFGFPDAVALGRHALVATALICVAIVMGAAELGFPLVEWLLGSHIETLSLAAQKHGVTPPGRGVSYRARLIGFALTLAVAPTVYLGAIAYMNDARAGERELARRAELAVAELALETPAGGALPDVDGGRTARADEGAPLRFAADAEGTITDGKHARTALARRPALEQGLRDALAAGPRGVFTHPREGAVAFRARQGQVIGVVLTSSPEVSTGTIVVLIVFLAIIAMWAPLSALFIAGSTAVPVMRISEALARVRDGEITAAPKVPVFHQDEVGALAENFNAMLDQLRELAARANAVALGDLSVDITVRGELGDAFRRQLESLREIVGHIAHDAVQLAGAATEMYAAAQEQEAAAHQQSSGIEEVSRTMDSLLAAATHVSESSLGVLAKAERTRETTGRTSERIAELTTHAGRIAEILDVIRDIADRSDLLALNASLEGTRAGEAGRGFALVAAEMRKLAERVTASVQDIKKLVADVRASVSATVLATEESSKLADGTTESAQQINLVTQQQRSGTEQAGHSMRDVASMITQSLAATQQVRSLAADLKTQADNLTTLVAKFRLAERAQRAERAERAERAGRAATEGDAPRRATSG